MTNRNMLYIPVEKSEGFQRTTIEGLIVLFLHKWSGSDLPTTFVTHSPTKAARYVYDVERTSSETVSWESLPWKGKLTTLPFVMISETSDLAEVIISGLAAVSRSVLKLVPRKEVNQALGFRQNCLQASAETSIWTHFCEVSMPAAIEHFKKDAVNFPHLQVPMPVAQFEEHLKQPVRMHNVVKRWQDDTGSTQGTESKQVQKMIPFWVEHTYAEGPDMTLADLLLFPCIQLFLNDARLKNISLDSFLPYTLKWHAKMSSYAGVLPSWYRVFGSSFNLGDLAQQLGHQEAQVVMPRVAQESLYKRDTSRNVKENVCVDNLETVVSQLRNCNLFVDAGAIVDSLSADLKKLLRIDIDKADEYTEHVAWEQLPAQAHPRLGQVPGSRLNRKIQQLDNMAHAVMENSRKGDVIVEFCSGSGHLGVVLAYLLPQCQVVLVDNKEESVLRARKRAAALRLPNITLIQSNLDYFCAAFSVGVALHACGVATDLVLRACLAQRASFVLCPCCYGNLAANLPVDYPQSRLFTQSLPPSSFFCISRAADDVTPTARACMNSVDLDRAVRAAETDYRVTLSKLRPESSTPKHNLLVGVPLEKVTL